MSSLRLGQDLGGTTVEGNGLLRDSAMHQIIRGLLVSFPLVLDSSHCSP